MGFDVGETVLSKADGFVDADMVGIDELGIIVGSLVGVVGNWVGVPTGH